MTNGFGALGHPILPGVLILLILIGAVLTPLVGPAAGVAAILAVAGMVAVLSLPFVALLLPILAAPVALRPLPGLGGLQVVHLMVLAAIAGICVAWLRGRVGVRPPLAALLGIGIVASIWLSTMTSVNPGGSIKVGINHSLAFLLSVCMATLIRKSTDNLLWVLRGWTAAAAVTVVPAIPSSLAASDRFGGALLEGRVQGVFAQPNDFGEFSFMLFIVAAALTAAATVRADRWIGAVGMAVGLAGVAVSFSRGTWIGLVVMLLVACVLSVRLLKPAITLLAVLTPVFAVAAVTGTPPFAALSSRLTGLFTGGTNPEDDRPLIYEQAFSIIREYALVGRGPGTFAGAAFEPGALLIRRPYIHGHSIPLTIGAEMGIVGLGALVIVTVGYAVALLRARRALLRANLTQENSRLALLGAGLVGIAAHGLLDVVYTNPFLIVLLWMLMGVVAGYCANILDRARPKGSDT